MIKFSVIIVNYNLTLHVIESIKSLLSFFSNFDYEIIVVDNNSADVEKNLLNNSFSSSNFLRKVFLNSNDGFGSGNNFGFNESTGEIIFLLNPDTKITQEIFDNVNRIFENYPHISVLGPKIINENRIQEKSYGMFPSVFLEFFNLFSLAGFIERKQIERKNANSNDEFFEVDWVTGAAMFIRRTAYESVNGFDTNFFMYSEEIDLCKRIKADGGKIIYYPNIELTHKGSVGSKKDYYFFTKTSYQSKYYYIKKHFKGMEKLMMLVFFKLQIIIQIILWSVLLPVYPLKYSEN